MSKKSAFQIHSYLPAFQAGSIPHQPASGTCKRLTLKPSPNPSRLVASCRTLLASREGDKVGIVAGGRRFRALTHLLETNDILASFPVPVRIADNEEQALEWANTENNARKDLNPVEEIKAYGTMAQKGFTPEKIAIAFAQTVRHVQRPFEAGEPSRCYP